MIQKVQQYVSSFALSMTIQSAQAKFKRATCSWWVAVVLSRPGTHVAAKFVARGRISSVPDATRPNTALSNINERIGVPIRSFAVS